MTQNCYRPTRAAAPRLVGGFWFGAFRVGKDEDIESVGKKSPGGTKCTIKHFAATRLSIDPDGPAFEVPASGANNATSYWCKGQKIGTSQMTTAKTASVNTEPTFTKSRKR